MVNLLELNYAELVRKNSSIGQLQPKYFDRARAVARRGGTKLQPDMQPDRWHFVIASGTTPGKSYDAWVNFSNMEEIIKDKAVNRMRVWNKDKTKIDFRKLAEEIVRDTNLQTVCSCPADLYYGGHYIRTKGDSKYTEPENRPPDIRNPDKKGAYCKHLHVLMDNLPFYISTMSAFLKKYYSNMIEKIQAEVLGEFSKVKQQAELLKQKQAPAQGKQYRRGSV